MLDHSGNLIDLPYTGCWSGCVKDYCYLFGTEVPQILYTTFIIIVPLIVISIGLILLTKFRKGGLFGVPRDLQ